MLAGSGFRVKLRGVFCHGSPMVDFSTGVVPTRCELADMLVVVDRLSGSRSFIRTASLVQAKMARAAGRVKLTGRSSVKQLGLYQAWPSFTFTNAAIYGTHSYQLVPSGGGIPGWFGVIDRHLKNGTGMPPPLWTQHPPTPTPVITTGGPTLGAFVTDAVFGHAGHLVGVPAISDWDRLVELLLRETYAGFFRDKATLGTAAVARGVTAFAFRSADVSEPLASTWPIGSDEPPIDDAGKRELGPARAGISVLHLEVGHDEGGRASRSPACRKPLVPYSLWKYA